MSSNKYVVKPEFRTNSLHKKGNGSTITVYYTTGESPKAYEKQSNEKDN